MNSHRMSVRPLWSVTTWPDRSLGLRRQSPTLDGEVSSIPERHHARVHVNVVFVFVRSNGRDVCGV